MCRRLNYKNFMDQTILPIRILLVDDDPLFTKAMVDTLQGEGHQVTAASNGQAGIETFQAALTGGNPFTLVITDLGMSPVDGRQVITTVKTISPTTPVILLTGWGEWFETTGGTPLKVDSILAKPPKLRELRDALARCLEPGQA